MLGTTKSAGTPLNGTGTICIANSCDASTARTLATATARCRASNIAGASAAASGEWPSSAAAAAEVG